jgi:uracil-DNA glycosylase family 4
MNKELLLKKAQSVCAKDASLIVDPDFTTLVYGKGNADSSVFIIGEAPGSKEDKTGIPFVGAAGKRLDGLLELAGVTIDDYYLANILKYRPTKNRDPKPDEIALHTPYLLKQIEIIKPKIIVTLGNFATKFVLSGFDVSQMKKIVGVSELHGVVKEISVEGEVFTVLPLYHPAAMIYRQKLRGEMEDDMAVLKKFLSST